jgi:hypothetical protein
MKANKTTRGWDISNHRRRKEKQSETSIDLAANDKILKQQNNFMVEITTHLSLLTLNVNGLNSPIKTHCLANCIKKDDLTNNYL